jgi:hypothetical protein
MIFVACLTLYRIRNLTDEGNVWSRNRLAILEFAQPVKVYCALYETRGSIAMLK